MENNPTIVLPREAIRYILLQRTGYLRDDRLFRFLSRLVYLRPLSSFSVFSRTLLFGKRLEKAFLADIHAEFLTLENSLPAAGRSILDVGCGLAAIDVHISRYYDHKADIFLLDRTSTEKKVYYDFNDSGAFYNSLEVSKRLLTTNGVPEENIHLQEATADNAIEFGEQFDIILSLISWGFHYPVETYIRPAFSKLKPGGIVILDIRKDTGGEAALGQFFEDVSVVLEREKYRRVIATKR